MLASNLIAHQQRMHLPTFAAGVAWPATDRAELRRSRCPPAIVAAMDGAIAAFEKLRGESSGAVEAQRSEGIARRVAQLASDCRDYSWEELHAGPWSVQHHPSRSCPAAELSRFVH